MSPVTEMPQTPQPIPTAPQTTIPQQPQTPVSSPHGSSGKTMLFALLTVLAVAIIGGGAWYFMNNSLTTTPTPTILQTNTPRPTPTTVSSIPTPNPIDADSQSIDQNLDKLNTASTEVDTSINDQATDLTP